MQLFTIAAFTICLLCSFGGRAERRSVYGVLSAFFAFEIIFEPFTQGNPYVVSSVLLAASTALLFSLKLVNTEFSRKHCVLTHVLCAANTLLFIDVYFGFSTIYNHYEAVVVLITLTRLTIGADGIASELRGAYRAWRCDNLHSGSGGTPCLSYKEKW